MITKYPVEYIHEPLHKGLLTATVRKDNRSSHDLDPQEVILLLNYFRNPNHPVAFALVHILTTTDLRNVLVSEKWGHIQKSVFVLIFFAN